MDYVKNEGRLIGYHFALAIMQFIFISFESWQIGRILLDVILSLCHICFYYSVAHNIATDNLKYQSKIKPYKRKGLVLGLVHIATIAVIAGILFLMQKYIYTAKPIYVMIYNFVIMPFKFLCADISMIEWTSYVIFASIPVITTIGYYLGYKKISIAQEYIVPLIYQKEE